MTNEIQNTELQATGNRVPSHGDGERTSTRQVFLPPTDIYETPDSIVLLAELPGVPPDAVDITLERRVLTIRGRAMDQEHANFRQIHSEYGDGDFERVFTLSEDIDRERIEAKHKDGLLHLVLPKAETAKARKIELRAN
jgi:HSP20 family protein